MRRMGALPKEIAEKLEEIRDVCAENHVTKLALMDKSVPRFGGDVPDFVVEFEPHADPLVRGRRYHNVWRALLDIVGDHNLVEEAAVENPWIRQALDSEQHDIYAAT